MEDLSSRFERVWMTADELAFVRALHGALILAGPQQPFTLAGYYSDELAKLCKRLLSYENERRELRLLLYGWLKGAKSALEAGLLPPARFDELIDMLKLAPSPEEEPRP